MKKTLLIILALSLTGCAVQDSIQVKDKKEYGVTDGLFRGRWWNFYERGLSFAEGEFHDRAIKDLKSAIDMRKSDQWRSRTYGMHFVNYFPHRELGVIYYKTERYAEAAREFDHSIKTASSAKARYFFNLARRSILQQSGDDKLSPLVSISYPPDGLITNKSTITLKGHAEDDYYVSSILVDVIPVPLELSAKNIVLNQDVPLKKGLNKISIRVSDLTGKITERILQVHSDRDGPIIIIKDQVTNGRKVIVTGFITDNTGISSFLINGKPVTAHYKPGTTDVSDQEIEFRQEIDLKKIADTIMVEVKDAAMNVTTGELYVSRSNSGLDHLPLLASSSTAVSGIVLDEYAFIKSGLGKFMDDIPPEIRLKTLTDSQTVYTDLIYFEGEVSDNSKIKSLLINGKPVIKRKGRKIFFNYLTTLREGKNIFLLEAVDIFENKSEKTVTVHRKIPKIRQIGSRMSISILPFERKGKGSIAGEAVFDNLISAFVNQQRFNLIERERIEDVLSELRLSQTELVEPDTASKIGKIVSADAILTGTIYESRNAVEVFTRLVDTETSSVIDAQDVFGEDRSLGGMKKLMQGLALKYRQSFPLLEGLVIKKDGKAVLTSLGENNNIKRNMGLILFREGDEIRHPVSKKVLGSEPVHLGEAKVKEIHREFSRALIRKGKPARIRVQDRVITK